MKSFLETPDFEEAILRIIANPSTTWNTTEVVRKTSQIRRVNRSVVRQLISGSQREDASALPHLSAAGLSSVPSHILSVINEESTDTAENRFIKHVLQVFLNFTEDCLAIFNKKQNFSYAAMEAKRLSEKVNAYLAHPFFHSISPASSLKLNSPLLQKRSGYREVLNRWLRFDLASRLIWQGGEGVYDAGKRNIATPYEYWIFFQLYDLVVEKFSLKQTGLRTSTVSLRKTNRAYRSG